MADNGEMIFELNYWNKSVVMRVCFRSHSCVKRDTIKDCPLSVTQPRINCEFAAFYFHFGDDRTIMKLNWSGGRVSFVLSLLLLLALGDKEVEIDGRGNLLTG